MRLTRRPPSSRLGVFLRALLVSVLGLELLYLLLANTILLTDVLERFVTKHAKEVTLTLGPSWSLLPGRVQVRQLDLVAETKDAEFELFIPEGTVHVSLVDLLRREFHATRVEGDDVAFKVRGRAATRPQAVKDALPPISGLPSPPSPVPPARLLGGNKDRNDNFAIHLENIDLAARELWFSEYRYTGGAKIRGGFYFRAEWALRIVPSAVEFENGALTFGASEPVARSFATDVQGRLVNWDMSNKATSLWTELDATVTSTAEIVSLAFLSGYSDGKVLVRAGGGPLHTQGRLAHGLIESARMKYETQNVAIGSGPLWVSGALIVSTPGWAPSGGIDVDIDAPRLEVTRGAPTSSAVLGWLSDVAARAEVRRLGGRSGPSLERARARIGRADAPDVGAIVRALGLGVDVSGEAHASAGAMLEGDRVEAIGEVAAKPVRVAVKDVVATAWGTIDGRFEGRRDFTGDFTQLRADISRATFRDGDESVEGWWASFDSLKSRIESWRGPALSTKVRARLRDAEPVWMLLEAHETLPGVVDQFLDMPKVTAQVEIQRSAKGLDLHLVDARSDKVRIAGRFSKGPKTCSAFLLDGPAWSVGVSSGKDGHVRVLATGGWLEEQLARCRRATSRTG